MVDDVFDRLLRRCRANRWARACAKTLGHFDAHLNFGWGAGMLKGLRVGVRHNELDPFQLLLDHIVHGVTTRAAHTKHRDARLQILPFRSHD